MIFKSFFFGYILDISWYINYEEIQIMRPNRKDPKRIVFWKLYLKDYEALL